jgi:hypothetical protein
MTKNRSQLVATIANGATDSDVKTVPVNATLLGIHVPAGMTGTALTFKVQKDAGSTAAPLKKEDGTAYTLTIGATAVFNPVDAKYFEGVQYVTIVSGTAETGAKELTLVFGQTG